MTNEEILKNAPEGDTHYSDKIKYYFKYHNITNWLMIFIRNDWVVVGSLSGIGNIKPL